MQESIDVVYVLGSGSNWNNNEIRFSLRSIDRYLTGVRNVYVIGAAEPWFKNVIHIPHPDELQNNADGSIIRKVLRACLIPELSQKFLFINDDHIILRRMNASSIKPYHKGDMSDFDTSYFRTGNSWRLRLENTFFTLRGMKLSTYHFDCHTPIVFDKSIFPEVMNKFNYSSPPGLTMKSLYGNMVHSKNGVLLNGAKRTIFQHYNVEQITARVKNAKMMSFNDEGLNPALRQFLYTSFPEMSKYENSDINDKVISVLKWFHGGAEYEQGVQLFLQYGKGANIKSILRLGENSTTRKKLEFKMKQIMNHGTNW